MHVIIYIVTESCRLFRKSALCVCTHTALVLLDWERPLVHGH